MIEVKKILIGLLASSVDAFTIEFTLVLSYLLVVLDSHINDEHKAAYIGLAVLVFLLAQKIEGILTKK